MQESLLSALRGRRAEIHARWEALLRIERVNTPLANPDALVFMIDWTCDELFAALSRPMARKRSGARPAEATPSRPECPCGRNPLLIYFAAAEQALEEALILEQARQPALDPAERDAAFAELKSAVLEIARREIESFCSVCQYRAEALACNHDLPAESAPAAVNGVQVLPAPCSRSR
jgi:hypothetical protein